jgi:hypothetical protein
VRENSRFAGHAADEPSAFDQRVRMFKERARLEVSRPEGEEGQASLNTAAAARSLGSIREPGE